MKKRDWTDAKFEIVKPPPRRVRSGWYFDWRNFLIVGGLSLAAIARAWLQSR